MNFKFYCLLLIRFYCLILVQHLLICQFVVIIVIPINNHVSYYLLNNETSLSQKPPCQGAFTKLKPQDIPLFEQNICVSSTCPLSDMTFLEHLVEQ